MNPLLAKLKKTSTIEEADVLSESEFFMDREYVHIGIPMLDVALSGDIDGGFYPGITMWAGPSKHFKTLFSLIMAKTYMDKFPDAVMLFYDSEFGTPISYFAALNIDTSRVLHSPLLNLENLKFDIIAQLEAIDKKDKVIIVIDSVGNIASKKEVEDAKEQKSVADMSRAKQLKSLFRMVTPYLVLKDIPCVVVNHVYSEQGLFPKTIVSGGTGSMYSSDSVFVLGRQQEKQGQELLGYNFVINVEKSRRVKEKSKIPISVMFDGGLSKYSGLLDVALEGNFVVKPSNGWYSRVDPETGEIEDKKFREKDTNNAEFWSPMLTSDKFKAYIRETFQVSHGELIKEEG